MSTAASGTTGDGYVPVYQPGTTWLFFRYDPERRVIEIRRRGDLFYVDLKILDEQQLMVERIHETDNRLGANYA